MSLNSLLITWPLFFDVISSSQPLADSKPRLYKRLYVQWPHQSVYSRHWWRAGLTRLLDATQFLETIKTQILCSFLFLFSSSSLCQYQLNPLNSTLCSCDPQKLYWEILLSLSIRPLPTASTFVLLTSFNLSVPRRRHLTSFLSPLRLSIPHFKVCS